MPLVRLRRDGDVAIVSLDRPQNLNALSQAVERSLAEALASDELRSARAVVVHGEGRAFCAGADIGEFTAGVAETLAYYRGLGDLNERLAALPVPTIAAIHGHCLGGGLELALACDVRVSDSTARFGLPEVGIGILPSSGGTVRLVRLLGEARARELILLGRRVDADDALRLGLVTEVVTAGGHLDRALAIAGEAALLPPLAMAVAKTAIAAAAESSRETGLLVERLAYAALGTTADAAEAWAAFRDRRAPRFEGR